MFNRVFFITLVIYVCQSKATEEEKKPILLSAPVGESVLFTCELDFPHDVVVPYTLNWNKEGERVFSIQDGVLTYAKDGYAGRVDINVVNGKANLNLTAIREPDHGWYECRLFFPNRTPTTRLNGTWFHLTVHGSDLLAVPPINQTVKEGVSAKLECVSKDSTARVTWYKDGIQLSSIPELSGRAWVGPEGSLTITNAQPSDPGFYKCEVVSTTGQAQSASAYLNVHYKARVIYTAKEVFLPIGRPGSLDCHFRANPAQTKVRWEKDGFLFDPFNVPGVFSRRNGSLFFDKVEESHAGEYTCTPNNELGTNGPSDGIHVVVQHPPTFTLTPHNMYLRKPGDSIHITCDAQDGESRPNIAWIKKDGKIPAERSTISGGNLTIKNIKESDQGLYQCIVSNEAATITADTELLIENSTPRGPHNLTGIVGENSVTLSWRQGTMAVSAQYSVWVRASDSPEWRTIKVSGSKATISSLDSAREYEFMVLSQDHNGDGMFSKPLKLVTKGTSPTQTSLPPALQRPYSGFQDIGAPRHLRITTGDEGYTLVWEAPARGTEYLDHYQILKITSPVEENNSVLETTKETNFLVGNLEQGHVYHFMLKSITSDGTESDGEQLVLHVPLYQKAEIFSLLIAALVGFLIASIILCVYINRIYVKNQIEQLKTPSH